MRYKIINLFSWVTGGLMLQGNQWQCDSRLLHLAEWLRRWLQEQLRFAALDVRLRSVSELKQATCVNPETGQVNSIFNLHPEDISIFRDKSAARRTYIINIPLFVYFYCYIFIRYLQ